MIHQILGLSYLEHPSCPRVRPAFLAAEHAETGTATIGRFVVRNRQSSVSPRSMKHLEADYIPGHLLELTLRRRGFSESILVLPNQLGLGRGLGIANAKSSGAKLQTSRVAHHLRVWSCSCCAIIGLRSREI